MALSAEHEYTNAGFWPGSGKVQEPAFYAYTYPEPAGCQAAIIQPDVAFFHPDLNDQVAWVRLSYQGSKHEPQSIGDQGFPQADDGHLSPTTPWTQTGYHCFSRTDHKVSNSTDHKRGDDGGITADKEKRYNGNKLPLPPSTGTPIGRPSKDSG